jgi:glycosyltransferase involved in cell wall biosynthesis
MPIYNTGRYLDDSIGSLVNQTINFINIQLILINDGSTDETEVICLKYKNKYPNNLLYLKIEHSGVSKARNIGLNYATGKYINFLDPDDKWDPGAFKNFLLFFEYYKPINFVSGRLKFFEASNDYHQLDYKFYKTRIVNLKEEYNCIQLSMASSMLKRSLLKGKYFDERIFSNEDTLFINNILLNNPKIGYIKEAIYYYRRRSDFTSVVQNYKYNILFYFDTINYVATKLIEYSYLLYNRIAPFIQFLISYDILFRIQQHTYKYLDSKSLQNYYNLIEDLLQKIEDKYILNQKVLSNKIKMLTLSKKYKRDLRYDIIFKNRAFFYIRILE